LNDPIYTPFGGTEIQVPDFSAAKIVVLPLCYENAVSYGTGCGKGPLHLLYASSKLERMDAETLVDWGDKKIHTLPSMFPSKNPETAFHEMKAAAAEVIKQNKFLLSLGGDHAVTIGPAMAAADRYTGLGVLHIDAHLDMRDEWNGSRYNHACVMRRLVGDMNLPSVHVGIRSFSSREAEFIRDRGIHPYFSHQLDPLDDSWIARAIEDLPQHVYLTIDLDGLDPSVLPGTGTPEPGGLTFRQVVGLIKCLGQSRKVVAADITELIKIEGSLVSEVTAAVIATKILSHCTP
jgi:agmatinase